MSFKKLVGKLHLWLGLASGLVVFLVSITGCILAFEHEIKSITLPFLYVSPPEEKQTQLPPSRLIELGEKEMNGSKASGVYYYETGKSTVVRFFSKETKTAYNVYINPYTGKILKVWNTEEDFFRIILNGHFNLWIPRPVGSYIVSYATLIFSILLLTGIILWWPKNLKKTNTDKSFKIKWNAKWRRVNYDLHNVPGFYIFFIALTLALTGMMFGIEWWNNSIYRIASAGRTKAERIEPISDTLHTHANNKDKTLDHLWSQISSGHVNTYSISFSNPADAAKPIVVTINPNPGTYYQSYSKYFDQYTGKEFTGINLFNGHAEELKLERFLHNLSYDIHVGEIAGLPGKILAFAASFVCASLPVSGFIIWLGRKKKEKKNSRQAVKIKLQTNA